MTTKTENQYYKFKKDQIDSILKTIEKCEKNGDTNEQTIQLVKLAYLVKFTVEQGYA